MQTTGYKLKYIKSMLKKYLVFIVFAAIVLFSLQSSFVLALELNYPQIPGGPIITGSNSLVQYIQYFFIFAMATAGIIGVMSLAISGIQILITAGNPGARGAAMERIRSSILGIILLMFSFIILRTINPELINPRTTVLPLTPGPYLMGEANCGDDVDCQSQYPDGYMYLDAPVSVSDTDKLPSGYTNLFYYCQATPANPGKTLLVWVFNRTDFQIDRSINGIAPGIVDTVPLHCGESLYIKSPVLSFFTKYEDPGVYFYLTNNCTGVSSCASGTDSCAEKSDIEQILPFDGQVANETIGSVRIVSGRDYRTRYGVILNDSVNYRGECSEPIINSNIGSAPEYSICQPMPQNSDGFALNPLSAKIIKQDPNPYFGRQGVSLYSDHLQADLSVNDIGLHYVYPPQPTLGNPGELLLPINKGYPLITPVPPDECTDPSVDCIRSIEPDGAYYIILYADNFYDPTSQTYYFTTCEVFNNGVYDFTNILGHYRNLYRMDIIPRAP